jgi:butyrate kinase
VDSSIRSTWAGSIGPVWSAAAGEPEFKKIWDAFIYGVAKDIGAMAVALEGKVDQILVTGGIAYSKYLVEEIKKQCGFIADVTAYPGEDELLALAQGALRVLTNEESAKEY